MVEDIFPVMVKDALITSHPVSTEIKDPEEIQQFFDMISYNKVIMVMIMMVVMMVMMMVMMILFFFFFLYTLLSQWEFSHGKCGSLSPRKASCSRVAQPNPNH